MEMKYKISVIVPIYKVEAYLSKCIESVLAQTYTNLEIILVDDGSPDSSGEIAEAYAELDSRIRVIHKENGGLSSARNAGIDIAEGEYLAFLDSDDWIAPDTYEQMLAAAEKYDAPLVCAGRFDVEEELGTTQKGLCPPEEECISGKELVRRILTWENVDSAAWDKLYRRELFREIRYPMGKVSEDMPTTYRIALDAGRAAMVPVPVYYYRHRAGSITTESRFSEKALHPVEHADFMRKDLAVRCPELTAEANFVYMHSLVYAIQLLDISGDTDFHKYREQMQPYRRELRNTLGAMLRCPFFTRRRKVECMMIAFGVYRSFRKVYHVLKG